MRSKLDRSSEKGQAALFTAMTMTVMMGLVGMVVDVGWSYWRREAAGTAATAAALSAGMAASLATNQACGSDSAHWSCTTLTCPANPPTTPTTNLGNGCLYAKQNGFVNTGRQSVTLTGGTSASPVNGISPAYWVSATATESIPTLFSAVIGQPWTQVSVKSTAAVFAGSAGGCVFVLDPTADKSYQQSGGNFATGCGIYIDSNKSDALFMTGGNVALTGGASIDIVGSKTQSGGNIIYSGGGSTQTGQAAHGDPFSGITAPTPAGTCTPDPSYTTGINITIPSGTYCALSIKGGTGFVLSGLYIITQGSFKLSGGNVGTAAGGATIYIAPTSTGSFQTSGGNLVLTAMSGGSTDGMAVWAANSVAETITGANDTINGVIYMPSVALTYTGGNTAVSQTIVSDTLKMTGGNISKPANSSLYSSGGTSGGTFIVQ